MLWRVSWWWCGFDGSSVRRRRVTGRRRWSGGVGCGCTSSPSGRLRLRGRRGPSRGRRARTGPALAGGLPGAWAAAPAQGGAHGSGRGDRCPRRRVARCRRWTGDLDPWSLWWTRPQGSPPSRCFRAPGRLFQGAGRAPVPRARAGGPADDAAVAHRPRDEGGATRNPVPGRHVGEVDHPAPVRTGRRRESRRARAERRPGSPWRAWWCAPSGPARRRSVPVPACAAPRCTGPPGALLPGARQPPGLLGSQRPRRSGSSLRARILSSRAASEIDLFEGGRDRAA